MRAHPVVDAEPPRVSGGGRPVTRLGDGLGIGPEDVAGLEPLASQGLTDEDRKRLADLGKNPPRDVEGLTMTHCVPDERHVVTR